MRARAVLLTLVALSGGAFSSRVARADETPAADADAKEKSRAAFRKGVAQLKAQDWAGARASFETAWSLFPHPSILLNLGIARLKTDDPVLAEQDLARFLGEDTGASPEEVSSARDALMEARSKIGTVHVIASPAAARISFDGKPATAVKRGEETVAEIHAKPGTHSLSVEADGYGPNKREVEVVAKGDAEVRVALARKAAAGATPQPPADEGGGLGVRKIAGYSCAGLAVVGLGLGTVFGIKALGIHADYVAGGSGYSKQAHDDGKRADLIADVSFGVAILAASAAVVLLFTDLGKDSASAEPAIVRW